MNESKDSDSPWLDPEVTARLKEGRAPDDIALLPCPKCGLYGYYNQGSHFTCRHCNASFSCVTEDEDWPDDRPVIPVDDMITLDDWEVSHEPMP